MTITKFTNSAGQTVRASLNFQNNIPVIPLPELRSLPELQIRLRNPIPALHLSPPREIDPENSNLLLEIKKAWCAAGRKTRKIHPGRVKVLQQNRLHVVREAVSILATRKVDAWTWSEFAQLKQTGRYQPSMIRWFTPKAVRDHIDLCAEQKPPARGWIIPLASGTKLAGVRQEIWDAVVAHSHVSIDSCLKAADEVATEQEFEGWLSLVQADADRELSSLEARIEAEEWVWPNW